MGYDASAYNVYGVVRRKSDLESERHTRGCSHPESDAKFCSECGKPMFITERVTIDLPQGNVDLCYSDYEKYKNGGQIVIGIKLSSVSDNDISIVPSITPEMFNEVKSFFIDNELPFNEKELAIYLMMYHSY